MKITISSKTLLQKLNVCSGAIASNPVLPILEDFLFDLEDGVLKISATDMETTIVTSVEVISEGKGVIAVPAKRLLDVLKALPNHSVSLLINEETKVIQIRAGKGRYKMQGEEGSDFPKPTILKDSAEFNLSSDELLKGINSTLFAVANDSTKRLSMQGVLFDINGCLKMVATDAHKLGRHKIDIDFDHKTKFIAPKKGLNVVKNNITNGNVKIVFNYSNVSFEFGDIRVTSRLIDDSYPNYNAVIPKDNHKVLEIDRKELIGALKRISIFANKTTNQVNFDIKPNELTVSSQDLDFQSEGNESIDCTFNDEPMTIAFNGVYLIEMLKAISEDRVSINLSKSTVAGILQGSEETDYLLMPVMLN